MMSTASHSDYRATAPNLPSPTKSYLSYTRRRHTNASHLTSFKSTLSAFKKGREHPLTKAALAKLNKASEEHGISTDDTGLTLKDFMTSTDSRKGDELYRVMDLLDAVPDASRDSTLPGFGTYDHHIYNLTHLPFKLQRRILCVIIYHLESAIFRFLQNWAPEVLAAKGWTDGEQVELNAWWEVLSTAVVPRSAIPADVRRRVYGHRLKHVREWHVNRERDMPVLKLCDIVLEASNIAIALGAHGYEGEAPLNMMYNTLFTHAWPVIRERGYPSLDAIPHIDIPDANLAAIRRVVARLGEKIARDVD